MKGVVCDSDECALENGIELPSEVDAVVDRWMLFADTRKEAWRLEIADERAAAIAQEKAAAEAKAREEEECEVERKRVVEARRARFAAVKAHLSPVPSSGPEKAKEVVEDPLVGGEKSKEVEQTGGEGEKSMAGEGDAVQEESSAARGEPKDGEEEKSVAGEEDGVKGAVKRKPAKDVARAPDDIVSILFSLLFFIADWRWLRTTFLGVRCAGNEGCPALGRLAARAVDARQVAAPVA